MHDDDRHGILCVDDDPYILKALERICADEGWICHGAADLDAARVSLGRGQVSCAILDVELDAECGLDLLAELRGCDRPVPAIMLTGRGYTVVNAMRALRQGAETMLPKPVDRDDLVTAVRLALEKVELRRRLGSLWRDSLTACGVVCRSPAMQELAGRLERLQRPSPVARDAPVLLLGETGTGKSTLADAIHRLGERAGKPFLGLSCANLSDETFESEFFGHERGAFTGADSRKAGLVEQAAGGTVFLDELQDLSLGNQRRIKTFVETRRFRRKGGVEEMRADVRLLCASNRDLKAMAAEGSFLDDLLLRVGLLSVELPGLNERAADLPELVAQMLSRPPGAPDDGSGSGCRPWRVAPEAMARLARIDYGGQNLRLLQKLLLLAQLIAGDEDGEEIGLAHLEQALAWDAGATPRATEALAGSYSQQVAAFKRRLIRDALSFSGGQRKQAADALGMSLDNLCKTMARMGIELAGD